MKRISFLSSFIFAKGHLLYVTQNDWRREKDSISEKMRTRLCHNCQKLFSELYLGNSTLLINLLSLHIQMYEFKPFI